MRRTLVLAGLALPLLAAGPWQPLFDGRDLAGWAIAGRRGGPDFVAENGAIHTAPGRGMLWYTRRKLANGTLRLVYRMSGPHGNSGVLIRIPAPPPDEDFAIHHGIEVQIDDRDDDWHCTGVLYSMTKALARPYKPAGEWSAMDITLRGLRTIVKLNGVLVTDYDGVGPVPERTHPWEPRRGPRPADGYIGLQHHDDRAVIYFREISFQPL